MISKDDALKEIKSLLTENEVYLDDFISRRCDHMLLAMRICIIKDIGGDTLIGKKATLNNILLWKTYTDLYSAYEFNIEEKKS